MFPTDNETYLIEIGDTIISKKCHGGINDLSPWEALVYCMWVVDYSMRNAGDLETAQDIHAEYHTDALRFADQLSLSLTKAAFSLTKEKLEEEYFYRFEAIVDEIKGLEKSF